MAAETWALIVAAGKGRRFGGATAKQFVELAGRPLLCWTIEAFERCAAVAAVQLVLAPGVDGGLRARFQRGKVRGVVDGGATRADSVQRGLAALPPSCELVAIHDGARPLVRPALVASVIEEARRSGAAIPALAVRDTVKRAEGTRVARTCERAGLHLAQTPQVFDRRLIERAYAARAGGSVTDDAQLVEQLVHPVSLVPGDPDNIKVTLPSDLELVGRLLAGASSTPAPRVGTGFDVHRLVPGRRLVLGGVELKHPLGLEGHSDADVLAHAVGDALLGAAALGDLGQRFPPDDPDLAGISSLVLLQRIAELLAGAGLCVINLDATVICEAPRLAPHTAAMRRNLAGSLKLRPEQISVKATTTEGLGFTGQGQGIAAQAVALLARRSSR